MNDEIYHFFIYSIDLKFSYVVKSYEEKLIIYTALQFMLTCSNRNFLKLNKIKFQDLIVLCFSYSLSSCLKSHS